MKSSSLQSHAGGTRCRRLIALTRAKRTRGFSLIEIVIGLIIAAMSFLAFVGAIIYSGREAQRSRDVLYLMEVANLYENRIKAGDFTIMGDDKVAVAGTYEKDYLAGTTTYTPDDACLGEFKANASPRVTVNITYTGWGTVKTNASLNGTSLDCKMYAGNSSSNNARDWKTDEWKNSYVTIVKGSGSRQVMRIVGNTASVLTVSQDLTASGSSVGWTLDPPTAGSVYFINDGKTFDLTFTMNTSSGPTSITRRVFLPRNGIPNA